jgi:hypothetical protein
MVIHIDIRCRAERKKNQVCSEMEYSRVFGALHRIPQGVEHLVVQLGESKFVSVRIYGKF